MKTYTVKNKKHEQDNINFIDVDNAKQEVSNYDKVLAYSIENGNITDETNIKSLCDGGDNVQPYFSENEAGYECTVYLENNSFYTTDKQGNEIEVTLKFHPEQEVYELY